MPTPTKSLMNDSCGAWSIGLESLLQMQYKVNLQFQLLKELK